MLRRGAAGQRPNGHLRAVIVGRDWFTDNGRGLALPARQCWPGCSAGRDVIALDAALDWNDVGCRWRAVRSPIHRGAYRGGDRVDR
jgi:hypothetical protein